MRFLVERSSWGTGLFVYDGGTPCEGAFHDRYVAVEFVEANDPAKLGPYFLEKWHGSGRNHRIESGHIKRDVDKEGWFVELESLEDLVAFIENVKEDVIIGLLEGTDFWKIEIYDSFRE